MTVPAAEAQAPSGTFSALRSPDFRLYFAGQLVSTAGTWMQNIAQAYLVFQITQQPLWSGIVACAAGLPLVLLSPIAGVIVDRVPRRRLMLFTQAVQMILAFILAALAFAGTVQVWHIVVLSFLLGTTNALDNPARQTIVLELVGRKELQSGIALNSIMISSARALGPTAAGLALVSVGVPWCFLLNGLSFLAVLFSLLVMKVPYATTTIGKASPLRQMMEGLHFARQSETVLPLLLLVLGAGLFILPVGQLLAPFASQALQSPSEGYAAVAAAHGFGSVVAGLFVTWVVARLGRGRVIAAMVGLVATATTLMALQTSVMPAAALAGLSGMFSVSEVISLNTQIQNSVPNEFRGRVMALYALAFFGMAPFGALLLGALGNLIGTAGAIGLAAVLGGIYGSCILLRWPGVVRIR